MYLSRLNLNPRNRAVQRDVANCQALHRTVMSAFPDVPGAEARERLSVLYRLDVESRTGRMALLVQSGVQPDWSRLAPAYLLDTDAATDNPACKRVDEIFGKLAVGMALLFRLRANPTKKIDTRSGPDGSRRNGKRVELRGEEAQIEWLRRKGEECAFELLSVRARPEALSARATPEGKVTGFRHDSAPSERVSRGERITFASVLFDGELRIVDAERFRQALERGIGPGKAYGFGLLSLAQGRR